MSTAALVPIAGAAAGVVASGASKAIANGLAFLEALAGGSEPMLDATAAAEPAQAPGDKLDELNSKLQAFAARLRERLEAMGIGVDPTQPLKIEEQPWGSIAADESHPQQAGIEAALAADPLLASEFHQLADEYRQLSESQGQRISRADQFQLAIHGDDVAVSFR